MLAAKSKPDTAELRADGVTPRLSGGVGVFHVRVFTSSLFVCNVGNQYSVYHDDATHMNVPDCTKPPTDSPPNTTNDRLDALSVMSTQTEELH